MQRLFLLAFVAVTLNAQNAPSLEDINSKLDKILKILEEADAPPPPPAPVKVDVSEAPALGIPEAPITIVEFTDMQCPYCNKFHVDTFPKLRDAYISTGKVRFVSRDLPLPMHTNAGKAAEAGRCAGEQGQFWEMRDWMQTNPTKLSLEDLRGHAVDLKLDLEKYRLCMASAQYREDVIASSEEAKKMNITGTPTFVIGKSGAVIEGDLMVGAQPYEAFAAKLDALLK